MPKPKKISHEAWAAAYKRRAYGYIGAMPPREQAKMQKAWHRKEIADFRHDPHLFKDPRTTKGRESLIR